MSSRTHFFAIGIFVGQGSDGRAPESPRESGSSADAWLDEKRDPVARRIAKKTETAKDCADLTRKVLSKARFDRWSAQKKVRMVTLTLEHIQALVPAEDQQLVEDYLMKKTKVYVDKDENEKTK